MFAKCHSILLILTLLGTRTGQDAVTAKKSTVRVSLFTGHYSISEHLTNALGQLVAGKLFVVMPSFLHRVFLGVCTLSCFLTGLKTNIHHTLLNPIKPALTAHVNGKLTQFLGILLQERNMVWYWCRFVIKNKNRSQAQLN